MPLSRKEPMTVREMIVWLKGMSPHVPLAWSKDGTTGFFYEEEQGEEDDLDGAVTLQCGDAEDED